MCGHAGNPEKSKTGGGVILDDAGGLGVDIYVLKLIATPKGTKLAVSMLMLLKAIEKLLNVNAVASCIFVCHHVVQLDFKMHH